MALLPTLEELKRVDTSHDLILSLTTDHEIIQFNKESERFTGFLRDEVLHKKLSDVLIPKESSSEWNNLLVSIQKNLWIDNFVLPLKTKANQVHMIIWTGFLVKDEQGVVKDICIFGKPVQTQPVQQPDVTEVPLVPPPKESVLQEKKPSLVGPSSVLPEKRETSSQPIPTLETQPVRQSDSTEIQFKTPPRESVPPEKTSAMVCQPQMTLEKTETSSQPIPSMQTQSVKQQDSIEIPSRSSEKECMFQEKAPPMIVQPSATQDTSVPFPRSLLKPVLQPEQQPLRKEPLLKHGTKKMLFAHGKEKTTEHTPPVVCEKPSPPEPQVTFPTNGDVLEKQYDVTSRKLDSILMSLTELSQKYETVLKRVTELETKKETSLGKNQTYLQDPPRIQPPPATSPVQPVKNHPKGTEEVKETKEQSSEEKEYTFFSDPFGLKRQHTELDLKKQRLDLRIKQLESFESRLMKEKDMLRARVEEFSKWQEKLMALESEIEKRRQDVMKQETMVLNKRPHSPFIQITSVKKDSQRDVEADIPPSDDETLETIPQSAAIIQRGILKQINAQFVDLLGYPLEEIVEKSYFDFIALEGLADVEKYYLDRLKGDSVSMYRTVFSTKDNKKIPVEVSIKQTIYNGEKAEIAVITSLNTGSV